MEIASHISVDRTRAKNQLKQLTLHRMDDRKDVREHLNQFFDTVNKFGEMELR